MKCSFCGGAVSWVGNLIDNPSTKCAGCGRTNCQEVEPIGDDYDEGDEDCAAGVDVPRAPDLLSRCLDTFNALLGDMEGIGSRTSIDDDLLPDVRARVAELTAACGVKGGQGG